MYRLEEDRRLAARRQYPLARLIACALYLVSTGPPLAIAGLPAEGDCPEISLAPQAEEIREDAGAIAIKTGMVLRLEDLKVLRRLIPEEFWLHREVFFHEGMRMEIGPCHRRYPVPDFYRSASAKFAGQARVDPAGNLTHYTAGLPFEREQIRPEDPDAGAKWAFNLEQRYIGSGFRGKFRITDFPDRLGGVHVYDGNFFLLKVSNRADLASQDYRLSKVREMALAAGGEFTHPFNARNLAWRQFRPIVAGKRYSEPDDIFAYIPTMRKVRRAAINWVDGLYIPRYSVTGDRGGGQLSLGSGGTIGPTAGHSIAVSEDMRRGMTGITLRANAYLWRVLGERDVLAPINSNQRGYPSEPERNYGPSGLSFANDRWDLRRVVVLEGALRVNDLDVSFIKIYLDYQSLQPLYWITRSSGQRLLDVGALAYRFSDDSDNAPKWPGGAPTSTFLPVAAAFYDAGARAGGWRRESFDLDATPPSPTEQRSMTTSGSLGRGR